MKLGLPNLSPTMEKVKNCQDDLIINYFYRVTLLNGIKKKEIRSSQVIY
jgi:hypothetical protein